MSKRDFYFIKNFLKSYLKYRYKKFNSKFEIEHYQKTKLIDFLKKVLIHSKFYVPYVHKFFKTHPLLNNDNIKKLNLNEILCVFPVLEKEEFLKNFDLINTQNIKFHDALLSATQAEKERSFKSKINNIDIGLSTGTSGRRGVFCVSPKEQALWAGLVCARGLRENLFSTQRIALILRANSNLYESLDNKNIKFKYFDLLNPIDEIYTELKKFNPTVVIGPPSALEFIAQFESKLESFKRMHPSQVISAAETLNDELKQFFDKTWDIKTDQIYQATEGCLAFTCSSGFLHLNEDNLIIEKEYIDKENGYFIPIITDFTRETQPIIRYRLNDVLVEDNCPCLCGSALQKIKRIEGRYDDVLFFDNKPIFPDFLTRTILKSDVHIEDFRIVQPEKCRINIALKLSDENFKTSVQEHVSKELDELFKIQKIQKPEYNFEPFMIEAQGQKRRRVKRCTQ